MYNSLFLKKIRFTLIRIIEIIVIAVYFIVDDLKIRLILITFLYLFIWIEMISEKNLKERFNLPILFYLMLSIFMYPRIFLTVFFNKNFGETSLFYPIVVGNKTQIFTANCLFFNLVGILIGVYLFRFFKKYSSKNRLNNVVQLKNPGIYFVIFLILYIFIIQRTIEEYELVKRVGYAAALYGELLTTHISLIVRVGNQIAICFASIYLALPVNRFTKYVLILMTFSGLTSILIGGRAKVICWFLFLVWFLEKKYLYKIKTKFFVAIIICLGIFGIVSIFLRNNNTSIVDAFWEQGVTVVQLSYLKEYYNFSKEKYGILLSLNPLMDLFRGMDFSRKISPFEYIYIHSKYSKDLGVGIGGNYIVDMFVMLKEFGIIIFSMFQIVFIKYIDVYLSKTQKITFLKIIFLDSLINFLFVVPRQGYFYIFQFQKIFYIGLLYLLIIIIPKYYIKTTNKYKS